MVKSFFETGNLDFTLNKTYISLIPKVLSAKSLNQFRPISFYNFEYKIVSKAMVNRLKYLLPELIATEQSALVSGR